MALGQLLDSFFTEEWARFRAGLAKLDPAQREAAYADQHRRARLPGEPATISLPGWDDVIHLGPRYQPTTAERAEWYAARREGRTPNLSQGATSAMQYAATVRERVRTSAQPGYAQAFGEVLTAIDNVQDLASSLATFGRLALYGGERLFNAFAPGPSAEAASATARAAARLAGQDAFQGFERALQNALARGEPIARFLLGDPIALAGQRRAAVNAAERAAYAAAYRAAILGLGSRLALRAAPVVGWVLLASDLLNMLTLLGMATMAAYALLCHGPQEALVAGIPAAVTHGGGKRASWRGHLLSPYSRRGGIRTPVASLGRLPSIGNLLEVAQTTDALFGWGVSLGGLVGTAMETGFAAERIRRGDPVRINTSALSTSYTDPTRATQTAAGAQLEALGARLHQLLGDRVTTMSSADLYKSHAASTVLTTAPAILGVQETFDDETHLLALTTYAAALATLAPLLRGTGWQQLAAELADVPLRPPGDPSQATIEWADFHGYDLAQHRGWWWPPNPPTATGAEYVEHTGPAIIAALREWLEPRRNTIEAAYYGNLVNAVTEALWLMLGEDPDLIRWELTTDARLLSSFIEAGRVINMRADANRLARMWYEAGRYMEATGQTALLAHDWDRLANKYGVPLITILPPGSPWPQPWHDWADAQPASGFADLLTGSAPPPQP